jgi:hypothetical protein
MADKDNIDFSPFLKGLRAQSGGRAATEQESKLEFPQRHTRPQREIERYPDYSQRKQEREGHSNWSGGSWGGGTFAGRTRGEREQ